jgi:hypothetical protein
MIFIKTASYPKVPPRTVRIAIDTVLGLYVRDWAVEEPGPVEAIQR